MRRHRLLVFRDQGRVSGQRQVEISHWFGPCESTFYKHSRAPHPDVFRVSNDKAEGCTGGWVGTSPGLLGQLRLATHTRALPPTKLTWCSPAPAVLAVSAGVGRTGWHVDGSFQAAPFSHALYHIHECPTKASRMLPCPAETAS